jgi:two-component system, chemotaxis family, CheB/CheR fusion protein
MSASDSADEREQSSAAGVTKLLDYLKTTRGFNFGAYKIAGLMRRVQKRMHEVGVHSHADYLDYLEVHPQEFAPLFDAVLINVTGFFREPAAWHFLGSQILPRIAEERAADQPIRVWSAGCASGEEALSLAMLFAETLGEEELRRRVKIYATDVDEGALAEARRASYDGRRVAGVPPDLLQRYFERSDSRYVFRSDLRRCLIFGRHDLLQDAAMSRLDLLVCRNTLMYFNSEAQEKILARFHFALNRGGILFLGRAETLLTHSNLFRPVDLKHRIFVRTATSDLRDRVLALASPVVPAAYEAPLERQRLLDLTFDQGAAAQIAVDARGYLVLANDAAQQLFGLRHGDLGRLLQDLELSYRPVELRSLIEEACKTRGPVQVQDVPWSIAGGREERLFEVRVAPLTEATGTILGATASFVDLTHARHLRLELERAYKKVETAYEELQSSNEELETTNEELHSTVEELETTNEELQSANEEQETMNEELQSTNEQLSSLNDRLQQGSEQLNQANAYLRSILASLRSAVVVVDRGLHVKLWNQTAEELWGLRSDEAIGRTFLDLDIGLPVDELRQPLRDVLEGVDGNRELVVDGVNRRGQGMRFSVSSNPLRGERGIEGIILLIEAGARAVNSFDG